MEVALLVMLEMQPKFFQDLFCFCLVLICCFLCFGLVLQACDESTECSPAHLEHFFAAAAAAARFCLRNGIFFFYWSWIFLCGFGCWLLCSCLGLFHFDFGCHGNTHSNTSAVSASTLRLLEASHMNMESMQVQGMQANTQHF